MKRWTIAKRITLGFSLVICLSALLGLFACSELRSIHRNSAQVNLVAIPRLSLIADMNQTVNKNRMLIYKHISSSDKEDMHKIESEYAKNGAAITELLEQYAKLADTDHERSVAEQIKAAPKGIS